VTAKAGYYIANSGTASATCTICTKNYYCTGNTAGRVACSTVGSGYVTDSTGATASSACHADVITSAAEPTSCSDYTSDANGSRVYNCSGGNVNGAAVSEFYVDAYCSTDVGKDYYYIDPPYMPCPNCQAAGAGSGPYCYCRLHSINNKPVVLLPRFFYFNNNYITASKCAAGCGERCGVYSRQTPNNNGLREELFNALGE
jgi:hypothetical protein